jgi:hypothetical protein
MSISAMKLALEALENTYAYLPRRWGGEVEADQAISALRQAIAEAEDSVAAEREACWGIIAIALLGADVELTKRVAAAIRARGET